MKLKHYVEHLNKLLENNPAAGDMLVVYSSDDEGNDYNTVNFTPTVGYYLDREFEGEDGPDDNAVCIN